MSNLKGKVAIITGGNSGIGAATAKELKAQGATVAITGRSRERVDVAAKEMGVKGYVADVTDLEVMDEVVSQIKKEMGNVDILFVNAGVFKAATVGQITEEHFDEQIDINFKGAVFTLEKFLPILNDGASVINLSSVNAYTGMTSTAIYAASKAALNAYSRTAAVELAPRKIRVNVVSPGPVSTPIFGKTGMSEEEQEGFSKTMQEQVPLKRLGKPGEIAKLVGFLASDDASWITGGEYTIDGGILINSLLG